MEMFSYHAEIGRLGCYTMLDVSQTSLTALATLGYSLAPVFIYVRHGCRAQIVSLLFHVFRATAEPSRLALKYVVLIECQLDTGVGGRENTAMALTCFPALRLCAYMHIAASTGTPLRSGDPLSATVPLM